MNRVQWTVFVMGLFLVGCGGTSLDQEITGKITFEGEPVTEGMVSFFKASTGSAAQGTLGEGGVFTLVQAEHRLPPGQYRVTINPLLNMEENIGSTKPGSAGGVKITERGGESIPKQYRRRDTSRLRADIPSESYDFNLVRE